MRTESLSMRLSQPMSHKAEFDALVGQAAKELQTTKTQTWASSTARRIVALVVESIESRLDPHRGRAGTSDAMAHIFSSAVQQLTSDEFRSAMVGWADEREEDDDDDDDASDEHSGFLSSPVSETGMTTLDAEKRVMDMISTTFKAIHAATTPAAANLPSEPGATPEAKAVGCHFVRKAIEEEARLAGVKL